MNLLYGHIGNYTPPPEEAIVRMTTAKVDVTKSPAEMDDAPVMGEVETDSDPNLGLANRSLASAWTEGQQTAPFWAGNVDQQAVNDVPVNSQVSSSGTAAAREASGQFGHGTLSFAEGIEPVQGLTEGGAFGNTYFARDKLPIQEGMGDYMTTPPGYTKAEAMPTARQASKNSREAVQSSIYEAFLFGGA